MNGPQRFSCNQIVLVSILKIEKIDPYGLKCTKCTSLLSILRIFQCLPTFREPILQQSMPDTSRYTFSSPPSYTSPSLANVLLKGSPFYQYWCYNCSFNPWYHSPAKATSWLLLTVCEEFLLNHIGLTGFLRLRCFIAFFSHLASNIALCSAITPLPHRSSSEMSRYDFKLALEPAYWKSQN